MSDPLPANAMLDPADSSDSDSPVDELEVQDLNVTDDDIRLAHANRNHAAIKRRYTREDADSLVGGEDVSIPDPKHKSSVEDADFRQKVFLFSLPFGGLSSIRSGFKIPFTQKDEDPEIKQLRLRLERQQSVTTIDEAKYFSSVKGTDDVRFRAVKASIKENISDFLPDFMQKKEKPYETIYHDITGPIVVMGGYRGSILRDATTGKRVWIPLKAGLNLRKINLLLGPTIEDELKATDLIYPDGVLKNVGPFDICKRFIKKLDNGKTVVKEFGYDWRLSLNITRDQLIEQLEKLKKETGEKVIVVAHSMGGLVAHGAMQKRPDLFRGLLYAGVPSECLNILGPIRYGDSIMFSDKILTFETNFMMRSSFCFLPLNGRVFANKKTGEWYDLDYFNPDTWVEYNLNPLVASTRKQTEQPGSTEISVLSLDTLVATQTSPEEPHSNTSSPIGSISSRIKLIPNGLNRKAKLLSLTNLQMQKRHRLGLASPTSPPVSDEPATRYSFSFSEAYDYLSATLKLAKSYVLGLDYNEELSDQYPPLAVVYGNKVPSVRGSYVRSKQDIKDGNYYEFFYGQGDGVVHLKWLMPENKGFKSHNPKTGEGHIVGRFPSSAGHVNLMNDFEAMAHGLSAIVEANKKWNTVAS